MILLIKAITSNLCTSEEYSIIDIVMDMTGKFLYNISLNTTEYDHLTAMTLYQNELIRTLPEKDNLSRKEDYPLF